MWQYNDDQGWMSATRRALREFVCVCEGTRGPVCTAQYLSYAWVGVKHKVPNHRLNPAGRFISTYPRPEGSEISSRE